MVRPAGVTVIAVLCFLGTALLAIGGILMFAGGGILATFLNRQGQGAGVAGFAAGFGVVLGVVFLAFAAFDLFLGIGLLKLKEWARIVTIVLSAIGAAFQLLGLLGTLAHFNAFSFLLGAFWLTVNVFIIIYLLKPEVKAAFQSPQARAASA
jgi:hypothetical protein